MKLSEKITRLRKARGLSQEELAEKLGVSRQAVSRWESGTALPDAGNLRQISRLFEVSADYLLDEERESPEPSAIPMAAPQGSRTNWRMIAGGCMAMLGFWGNVAIYMVSRFVEVMIPFKVWSTDHSTWQYRWDSNVTGHSWWFFIEEYDLQWVAAVLALLLAAGVVLLLTERRKRRRG